MLQKPHWLKTEEWHKLLQAYGGIPRCAVTGETEDLSVDHIVPKHLGGTDDASNLQFLKKSLNCQKWISPDKNWNQTFYFDHLPNLAKLRSGQRDLFNTILGAADWFSHPASSIARLLYLASIIVAGGKTIAPIVIAAAYNSIMRARWGAVRRADRILILTKERAIRDQIARDLLLDLVDFGIYPTKPRIVSIQHEWQFANEPLLMAHDIVVSCLQQIWEKQSDLTLAKLLHRFPLIFFDEPHFASDRVLGIVEQAATSVCFGATGTPIDGAGNLLPRMINLLAFGFPDANLKDHSLKFLADGKPEEFIKIATLDSATMLDKGKVYTRSDTNSQGYEKNFEPAKSVAWEVILQVERCDQLGQLDSLSLANEPKAPHRENYPCEVGIFYPVHALISCDNVRFANHLCDTINDLFERDPGRFPQARGFHCDVVHCEGEEPDGKSRVDKPLLPNHPWMRAKNQPGWRIDEKCSRFLIVVGMGREGVNNPLCGIVGVTSDHASLVEAVQRIIGRQMRAVTQLNDNEVLLVPPALLDTVTIITHAAFQDILPSLENAIDYVMNMAVYLQGLPTIVNLQAGEKLDERKAPRDDFPLPFKTKIQAAGFVRSNPKATDEEVIKKFGGGASPKGNQKLIEWVNTVKREPDKIREKLRLDLPIISVETVLLEQVNRQPDDEALRRFLGAHYPHLATLPLNKESREFAVELFKKHAAEVNAATPVLLNSDGQRRTLDDIRRNMYRAVLDDLGACYQAPPEKERLIHQLIGKAVKIKLGVPEKESAKNGSQWDIPNCQLILERSEVQRELRNWVITGLIDQGCCPALEDENDDQA